MKNCVNENLTKISTLMAGMPDEMQSYEDYMKEIRIPLNACLVECALGAELGYPAGKNEVTVKFNGKQRVNEGEIALIKNSLSAFINGVETPFLNKITGDCEDELAIPASSAANIFSPEKINGKTVSDMVSLDFISNTLISAADIDILYEVGQKLHKKKVIKWSTIIGAAALVLTGGAIAWAMHEDKDKEETETEIDNGEIDGEIEVSSYDETEIPEVEIPETEIPE